MSRRVTRSRAFAPIWTPKRRRKAKAKMTVGSGYVIVVGDMPATIILHCQGCDRLHRLMKVADRLRCPSCQHEMLILTEQGTTEQGTTEQAYKYHRRLTQEG